MTPDEYGRLSTIEKISLLPPDERMKILDGMSEAEMLDHRLWLRPAQMEVMADDSPIVLMCAGRGSGKTRVGASWICEQAKVPGTRLHLVGRTVQDVREVMVQGESGIIAVSEPDFMPDYTPTLRRITWPNDSKAITYTSETPDALRGPQSHATWCLDQNAVAVTIAGEKPLREIRRGDLVLGGAGWTEVLDSRFTGVRRVLEIVTSDGSRLRLTPEHKVSTARGWMPARDLNVSDRVKSCLMTSGSHPPGKSTTASGSTERRAATTGLSTERLALSACFIESSGQPSTALLTRTPTSTTSTVILPTTDWRTSKHSRGVSTGNAISRSVEPPLDACGPSGSPSAAPVTGAELSSSLSGCTRSTAQHGAGTEPTGTDLPLVLSRLGSAPSRNAVSSAEDLSSPSSIEPSSVPADARRQTCVDVEVVEILDLGEHVPVWDLTTTSHEFFAGGMLVHNCDELATFKMKPDTSGATIWDNVKMSTRLGPHPQIMCTTTPRRVPIIRELIRDARADSFDRLVSLHGGSTLDNRANLSPVFIQNLLSMYEGTALARQELHGEFLDFVEGALWRDSDIVRYRTDEGEPERPLKIIGVDPGVTTGGDATGIVTIIGETIGDMPDRRAWILRDDTEDGLSPERWAARVIQVWREEYPAIVVAEKNQGGELVSSVLNQTPGGEDCPVLLVSAKGSKAARAEPVLMCYRQRRVFHETGADLGQLEAEMTSWEPGARGFSPNRLDAMVHAVRALLIDDRMLRHLGYIYAAEVEPQVIPLSSARRDPDRARASMRSWRSR